MGTTPDCGPHCTPPTATHHETHCSCKECHGKPVNTIYPLVFPELQNVREPTFCWICGGIGPHHSFTGLY